MKNKNKKRCARSFLKLISAKNPSKNFQTKLWLKVWNFLRIFLTQFFTFGGRRKISVAAISFRLFIILRIFVTQTFARFQIFRKLFSPKCRELFCTKIFLKSFWKPRFNLQNCASLFIFVFQRSPHFTKNFAKCKIFLVLKLRWNFFGKNVKKFHSKNYRISPRNCN